MLNVIMLSVANNPFMLIVVVPRGKLSAIEGLVKMYRVISVFFRHFHGYLFC